MKYRDAIKLEVGEDVTMLVNGKPRKGTVDIGSVYAVGEFYRARDYVGNVIGILFMDTEGSEWCRGHEGPAVDALLTANALT